MKTDLEFGITNLANIKKFEADNLAVFNGKFNATKFASDIIKNSDVDTIDVKTSIAQNYPIVHGLTSVYNYTFENKLVEGSLRTWSKVIFSYDLDEQRLYDRGGYVYIKNNKGLKDIVVVGTIDYETGVVSIKTNILEGDELSITVNTESSNINSKNNVLLHFGKISISQKSLALITEVLFTTSTVFLSNSSTKSRFNIDLLFLYLFSNSI